MGGGLVSCLVGFICLLLFCISQYNITDVSLCWFFLKTTVTFPITKCRLRQVLRDVNKCVPPFKKHVEVPLRSHSVSVRTAIIQWYFFISVDSLGNVSVILQICFSSDFFCTSLWLEGRAWEADIPLQPERWMALNVCVKVSSGCRQQPAGLTNFINCSLMSWGILKIWGVRGSRRMVNLWGLRKCCRTIRTICLYSRYFQLCHTSFVWVCV